MALTYLAVGHGDGTIIGTGRKTLSGTNSSAGSNARLRGAIALITTPTKEAADSSSAIAATSQAAKKTTESAALAVLAGASQVINKAAENTTELAPLVPLPLVDVVGDVILDADGLAGAIVPWGGALAHEVANHSFGRDGAVALGTTKGATFAGVNLAVSDDGGVGLGATAVGAAVTRGTISDGEAGHGDAVGALDGGHDTVGRGNAGQGSNERE